MNGASCGGVVALDVTVLIRHGESWGVPRYFECDVYEKAAADEEVELD